MITVPGQASYFCFNLTPETWHLFYGLITVRASV